MPMRVKERVQGVLRGLGVYQRVRYSWWYDLYWGLVDRRFIEDRSKEVLFFREILQGLEPGSLIFDIGANRGYKTDIFLRLGARVVAVDPDPSNEAVLTDSFLRWRVRKKPVSVIGKAVSDRNGAAMMWIDEPGSGKNTLNTKWVETLRSDGKRFGQTLQFADKLQVETTTLEDLMRAHGKPLYVKIDVEGHEPSVLRGMSFAVPYISFEANLPEFAAEAAECIHFLEELAPGAEFNYAPNCRGGMALDKWVDHGVIRAIVAQCAEPSIEIFCKSPSQ